ncbi:aldehyde ferredoxin oxidoreductase family protein [Brassicibacter mesophilus]|uniref:aldehyde ferredoxin oxidoreductase family protein n=1 Tax=Brassicibacter mesophilus TaxID=745119 RepID=UPI003D2109DB
MSTKYGGYMGKILKIDLTSRQTSEYPWPDNYRDLFLGGKIMAAKIIYDNVKKRTESFSKDNYLVISTGPLTGTGAPASSRFNVSTLSPLTGLLTSSNCGGSFGLYLKKSGYDALVVTGKSEAPIWIEITEENIVFHDASDLWGKTTSQTQELLGQNRGKIVIGPAGENLVKYAGIFSEERAAGRGGTGAVMGSKNLKAIVAYGRKRPEINSPEETKELYKEWVSMIRKHPLTGEQLPKLGTAGLVSLMQNRKILATRNFKYGQYNDFEMVSGEELAEKHLIRNKGCITCPIQCGRQVEIDGKKVKGPELETLVLLGSNIENNNLENILRWNYELDELGMDTISTAGTIAFAMELNEKGLWDNGLEFGNVEGLSSVFEDIAYKRGIGELLAEGSRYLSKRFGGEAFAIHSKGMELAAYEPRGAVGQGLGYAVANRGGCHLNAGYMVLFEGLGLSIDPYSEKGKAELAVMSQNIMEAVSAGGNCLFTLYTMFPEFLIKRPNSSFTRFANKTMTTGITGCVVNCINKVNEKFLPINLSLIPHTKALSSVTGMKINLGRLKTIGERGYNLERIFNIKMGLNTSDDSLPERLTDEPQNPDDIKTVVPLEKLKANYYKSRGWDNNGIPKKSTLKKLHLEGEF